MANFPQTSRSISPLGRLLTAAIIAASTTLSACVGGLALCIPPAVGVPGDPGAPNFWERGDRLQRFSDDVNDPRWTGAVTFPLRAPWLVTFRGLHSSVTEWDSVFLSWHLQGDPQLSENDLLYVGFTQASDQPVVIEIQPFGTSRLSDLERAPLLAAGTNTTRIWRWDGTSWVRDPARDFGWVWNGTSVWGRRADGGNSWGVQMVVPIRRAGDPAYFGLNLGTVSRMWFEVRNQTPEGPVSSSWPDIPPVSLTGESLSTPFRADDWGEMRLLDGAGGSDCGPFFGRWTPPPDG